MKGGHGVLGWSSREHLMRTRTILQILTAGILAALAKVFFCSSASSAVPDLLQLETKISLGNVAGRIDHMDVDLARRRLFVAELGKGSVSVIDLDAQKIVRRIAHFHEPQGLAYVPETDTLYVASGGDGSLRMLKGAALNDDGRIDMGADADNVRLDPSHKSVFVGYGRGGLAEIDIQTRREVATIALPGHPEGFQLESNGNRIFVNVPDAGSITVLDRTSRKIEATWPTSGSEGNFPMALDEDRKQVLAVFRSPPKLIAFTMDDGSIVSSAPTCADSDDLFLDEKRRRVYVSCGEGFIDVFKAEPGLERMGNMATAPGARTSLFVPALDRFFVAIRASLDQAPAIWVFKPLP
jgi:hypothetical protein